ncbi:hypothetical protein KI659_10075 [Litoribacter alkaliphilus]|uniref:Uncharacterized protein n=1 Tax=Litoribacter ruber TaxID=702568 RepID=A0AAP2G1L7_9BACT|nr:hypothetical protein [Litoribacter alkaliphilus]MBS9524362.1 hypothetical protein [Litoribacter alkaliphilus]
MNRNRKNRSLLKERVTILMVVFFCILISGSERFIMFDSAKSKMEQAAGSDKDTDENETFIDVAVDAVVPFATTIAQTALYFIYEIIGFEKETFTVKEQISRYPSHFLEILLTRIISPNAP